MTDRGSSDSPARSTRTSLWAWALTAVLALGAIGLGQRYFVANAELRLLRDREQLAQVALQTAQSHLEAEQLVSRQIAVEYAALRKTNDLRSPHSSPQTAAEAPRGVDFSDLQVRSLRPPAGTPAGTVGTVIWSRSTHEGLLAVEQLSLLPGAQRYALWILDAAPNASPIKAGAFSADSNGQARLPFSVPGPVSTSTEFVVSRETTESIASHDTPGNTILTTRH